MDLCWSGRLSACTLVWEASRGGAYAGRMHRNPVAHCTAGCFVRGLCVWGITDLSLFVRQIRTSDCPSLIWMALLLLSSGRGLPVAPSNSQVFILLCTICRCGQGGVYGFAFTQVFPGCLCLCVCDMASSDFPVNTSVQYSDVYVVQGHAGHWESAVIHAFAVADRWSTGMGSRCPLFADCSQVQIWREGCRMSGSPSPGGRTWLRSDLATFI